MDKMDWALWALKYLRDARVAVHEDFNDLMKEIPQYHRARLEHWYSPCKNIIQSLYHFSSEFVENPTVPSASYASPEDFERKLNEYRLFVKGMEAELESEDKAYRESNNVDGPPFLVGSAQRMVEHHLATINYVISKRPIPEDISPEVSDVMLVAGLARRFHEAVLSLKTHPHGGEIIQPKDEWDCQYLFRAILASYFADIRDEEWNPSVAGTSARCEFYLKNIHTMVELKFVRKSTDNKKVKQELATDFLDYGANDRVEHVVCLVYDPECKLKNATALQSDLSTGVNGLSSVTVVVSPPRDV
ncbi:hypothetical protein V6R98_02465 [Agrobacterium sp. CCNWLW71]|uniref:PD-(D/E)XK nuclease domain-containing protein n=1 Tax=unclassified Agrobacterium TaxID=2632611 RepID=UPI002FEE664C